MGEVKPWYPVENIEEVDSPALLLYKEKVIGNIELVKEVAGGNVDRLRPHVKTHKIKEVCLLMLEAGIRKFKCATIAEAEMLAMAGAPDVLLAYQPTGPKIKRLIQLTKTYPATDFACLVDDIQNTRLINELAGKASVVLPVYIDLNVGMNRTGIHPKQASVLADSIRQCPSLLLKGLHAYDGQIHSTNLSLRTAEADLAFAQADRVYAALQPEYDYPLTLVIGGTPTFPIHIRRQYGECSPGTFVFWDWGYMEMLPDQPFRWAALVVTRVISIVDQTHICTDLGHKSVAAESPLPRVWFFNAPEASSIAQSEEHLVLKVADSTMFTVGQVLYGVPVHICPTVALYDKAHVIENRKFTTTWDVIARNRSITV
ncbi:D-TA family PLP-dependent enzyme [Parabacteroides sp. PF5-6]|uniref:D-TA family PLP-dependent enzyme n=1 Tax=Parabacteroides sp. PF5-6 TaxID=1742403 RepID=UPI0024072FAE|nr:D-TA family PLP-dependent enzyme [Parabacteroides sp. PF5-6]MDF9828834.1 D-serine deaminase-like pyridoxal phosphate-dependent protein [Parabacteroides sp. PF5-6]